MPLLVPLADVIVNVGAVSKVLVAGRAVVLGAGTKVLVLHVPPYLGGHSLPAYHADKSAIAASPKVIPHQLVQSKTLKP